MFVTVINPLTNEILYCREQRRKQRVNNRDLDEIANELAERFKKHSLIWIEFRVCKDIPHWPERRIFSNLS